MSKASIGITFGAHILMDVGDGTTFPRAAPRPVATSHSTYQSCTILGTSAFPLLLRGLQGVVAAAVPSPFCRRVRFSTPAATAARTRSSSLSPWDQDLWTARK